MMIFELITLGKIEELTSLLANDPSLVNSKEEFTDRTPLHIASMRENPQIIALLAHYKPDTSIDDMAGITAIEYALLCKNKAAKDKMVHTLVTQCGVNLENKLHLGGTLLRDAVNFKNFSDAELLLKLGADPLCPDDLGRPLLETLVIRNYPTEWFQLFISYGALIGCHIDFKSMTTEQIDKLTKGQPAWATTVGENNEAVTNNTPGFTHAVTNSSELKKTFHHINDNHKPNNIIMHYGTLIRATKNCENFTDRSELQEIVNLLDRNTLKYRAALTLFKSKRAIKNLPPEIQEYVAHVAVYEAALQDTPSTHQKKT